MKLAGLVAVCVTALCTIASPAAARPDFRCDGVFKGKSYDGVVVPRGAACTLIGATVDGDVRVLKNAYFQAAGTVVRGDVEGEQAQTVFIDTGSRVSGSVEAERTAQFFVFNSTVREDIEPNRTTDVVQICGNTVRKGNIEVRRSRTDILIGDPSTAGCRGNVVKRGDIVVSRNFTDVEFVIRGNTVRRGNLELVRNTGPVTRFVEGNTGGDRLVCRENGVPLAVADNTGWSRKLGQCT